MTVYVDDMEQPLGALRMCHMIADTSDELNAMADRLGMDRRKLQHAGSHTEHYDVGLETRAIAIEQGAQLITWMELSRICWRRKGIAKSSPVPSPAETAEPTPRLRPCAFCGSTAIAFHPNDLSASGNGQMGVPFVDAFYGHCDECGAEGPQCDSEQEAVEAWNCRAEPPAVAPKPADETLRQLALAATPGPWRETHVTSPTNTRTGHTATFAMVDAEDPAVGFRLSICETGGSIANAQYIAAANPSAILALLARAEAAEQRAKTASAESIAALQAQAILDGVLATLTAERDAALAALETEKAANAELRTIMQAAARAGRMQIDADLATYGYDSMEFACARGAWHATIGPLRPFVDLHAAAWPDAARSAPQSEPTP